MAKLIIVTKNKKEVVDITEKVNKLLEKDGVKNGLVHLFLTHTTCALSTADLDPGGTDLDYLEAFEKIIPKISFRHPHDPNHMPDHILGSIIGPSITIPFKNGRLNLGVWQRLVLFEFNGPKERQIFVSILSENY